MWTSIPGVIFCNGTQTQGVMLSEQAFYLQIHLSSPFTPVTSIVILCEHSIVVTIICISVQKIYCGGPDDASFACKGHTPFTVFSSAAWDGEADRDDTQTDGHNDALLQLHLQKQLPSLLTGFHGSL